MSLHRELGRIDAKLEGGEARPILICAIVEQIDVQRIAGPSATNLGMLHALALGGRQCREVDGGVEQKVSIHTAHCAIRM